MSFTLIPNMKNYTASKPYVIVVKDGKIVHKAKIRIGGAVVTADTVEWFDDEAAFNARVAELTPKK